MSEPEGRAMLMPLLRDDVLAGDVRRAVEQVEDDARAELRASLAAKFAELPVLDIGGLNERDEWESHLVVDRDRVEALLR